MTNYQQFINKDNYTELQAVYEVDQMQEANIKAIGAHGRWMPYNAAGAALLRHIQEVGYRDEGTGSTFAALDYV